MAFLPGQVTVRPGAELKRGWPLRRRALLWMAGLALVALTLLLTDRLLWQPGLTEDNVRRIRPGMPLAEVEALLGGPPGGVIEGKIVETVPSGG